MCSHRHGHNLLLTSVAALLMATSAAHARPELSKTESWKLTLGIWCVGDHPNDNEAYVGIARDQCGENEATLVIGENGYTWEREEGLSCRYSSGKARFESACGEHRSSSISSIGSAAALLRPAFWLR